MMKILVPNNNNLERKYILDQILREYLGLQYELIFEDTNFDYVFINGEKELVIKDVFFNQFPNQLEYLSLCNIPDKIFYAKNTYINNIVFFWGDDVVKESKNRLFCGVDIFASAFFMLTRWEEFILREKTGRCNEQMLLCVKYGLQKRPIVNEYCDVLITLLSKIGIVSKRPIYNQIKITHDVDRCYLSSYMQLFSNLLPLAFRNKQYKKAFIALKNFLIYKIKSENPFDCFNELMDYSDKYNFINSFYFKACKEMEGGYTYTLDNSFVKKTILNIINRGHEVGFHPSENSFDNDEQFKLEYLRLQTIAGEVIRGGRNHGLYYNMNTMRQWNEVLDYDSGLGYQFSNGFRSGICYPYNIFDVFKRETLKLVEIPFVAMDTVAIRTKWTPQELFDDIVGVINVVNRYNGIVCFNWHSNQINVLERKKYKWVYFSIIDFLAQKKKLIMDSDILVSISCITYNHEPWIRKCLEGFVMQKTNFKFEILIHDDASTDGTANIIREYLDKYPNLIKPIFQIENQYSKGIAISQTYNWPRAKGKYIALCEGDDYWTDPYKLQKQVDFLEANPEFSMCFANAIEHWEDGTKEDKCFSNVEDRDYTGVEIYENWIVPTASVLYRKEIVFSERYKEIILNKNFIFGDIVLFLSCAEFGKLRGMSDVVSVYRRHEGGVTNQVNKTVENKLKFIRHKKAIGDVFGKTIKGVKYTSKKIVCKNLVNFFIYGWVYSRKLFFSFITKSFAFSVHLTLFYLWVELKKIFSFKIKKVIKKIKF